MPKQFDLVWVNSEPHAEHEFGGHNPASNNTFRPMLVVSSTAYNKKTKMIVGYPITSTTSIQPPYQFQLDAKKIHGYVILTGLLGYEYIARDGHIAEHASARTQSLAKVAVKDTFSL